MSLVTNVVRRGASYYFRVRVPKDLVPIVGRRELWKSLRTSHILDARQRGAVQAILTQALWGRLHPGMTMNAANQILKEWLAAEVRDYVALRDDLRRSFGAIPANPSAQAEGLQSSLPAAVSAGPELLNDARPGCGLSLSQAVRTFTLFQARSGELKAKRVQDYAKAFAAFEAWCGDDRDLVRISNSDAGRFKSDLCNYPARGSVRPGYRDLDFKGRVALSLERGEEDTLDPTTINNKYLTPLRAMFDHFRRSGYGEALAVNPFDGISAKRGRKAHRSERKRDFTVPELQRLFDLPLFTGSAGLKHTRLYVPGEERVSDWRYWIPLISIFSGVRLNEACGLTVSDFKQEDGIDYFLVRDVFEDQAIKTDGGWRRVPLHRELIALDLLGHVERQRQAGCERLFPDLTADRFGYLSSKPSKFFSDLIARIKDPDPLLPGKLTPHSTRHTVIGKMRSAGVRLDVATEVVGHEDASTHAGYGGIEIAALKEAVDRIVYKELDLSRVGLPSKCSG